MAETWTIELADCEAVLLRLIPDKTQKQKDIACVYAAALASSERERIDWRKVNAAIVERWSMAGLERIKKLAWSGKCFD